MLDVFEEIRARVPLVDVFALYGLRPNRAGYVSCPIHAEKTPSLKLYPASWRCYGCNTGGDGVKLVELLDNLTPIQAARKLSESFNLDLFPDKPLTAADRRKIEATTRQRKQDTARLDDFDEWERWACRTVTDWIHQLEAWKRDLAPKTPEDEWDARFCEALKWLDYWDYIFDEIFIEGDFLTVAEFYKTHESEVRKIAARLDENRKTEST